MKKILMIITMLLLIQTTNVYANCQATDGCKDCTGQALTNCMNSNEYKAYKDAKELECRNTRCKNISDSGAYEICMNDCRNGGSSGNSGNGSNGGGSIYGNGSINNPSSPSQKQPVNVQTTVEAEVEEKKLAESCDTLIGTSTETGKMIHDAYNILKFVVPLILLAMSIKDFGTAIISQDDSGMKKATSNFGKRLIIAILILVLPTILNFVLNDLLGVETCFL